MEEELRSVKSSDYLPSKAAQQKKNLLQKALVDQCKELCQTQNTDAKQFSGMFYKIITRLQQWTLFDDKQIQGATTSLLMLANS
jgi:hypothetical protein